MRNENLRLVDGSKVAVIGGGPAGTSCAIKLLKEAEKKGLKLKVIIFESKDFNVHYNQCVGVLSPPVEEIFEKFLGIGFPTELIKREINGYNVYTDGGERIELKSGIGTYATRRILFDRFMLETAKKHGAEVINSRVTDIEFYNGEEVRIYSEGRFMRVDAVVGSFGLDEGTAELFERSSRKSFKYKRPSKALDTVITKIHIDKEIIENKLMSMIHAFLLNNFRKIEFGAITPKGDHIIINIAGRNVTSLEMDIFLNQDVIRGILGEIDVSQLDYFKGRYPIKPAKGIVGDRFVAVGDATGWIRPYKGKGINVAILTGAKAAEVMINSGISRDDLMSYVKTFEDFQRDYIYGKIFRTLLLFSLRTGFIREIVTIKNMPEKLRDAIYMAVSGEGSYYEILKKILSPDSFLTITNNFLKFILR